MHRYGWRAYALPLLTALSVFVAIQLTRPSVPTPTVGAAVVPAASPPAGGGPAVQTTVVNGVSTTVTVAGPTTTVKAPGPTTTVVPTATPTVSGETAADPNGAWAANMKTGALPPGGAFTVQGKGTWKVIKGTSVKVGAGTKVLRYTIEVEDGVTPDTASFAQTVESVLADSRSWISGGDVSFQRIDTGTPDFRISLTSQLTMRDPGICGYDIPLESSCYNRAIGRVLINDARWERGAVSYNGDLALYRAYAINHEVGHALHFSHQPCGVDGGLAPVMMQQSFSTANDDLVPLDPKVPLDGKVCRANPYPYPLGRPSATGATATG